MESFTVKTRSRTEFVDVTHRVEALVEKSELSEGTCTVYVPHTTAAITVNESADPSVQEDALMELNKVIPFNDGYAHREGNSAAHIKSILVGESVTMPVENGGLVLGTWQGIFFCEFDGARTRKVQVILK